MNSLSWASVDGILGFLHTGSDILMVLRDYSNDKHELSERMQLITPTRTDNHQYQEITELSEHAGCDSWLHVGNNRMLFYTVQKILVSNFSWSFSFPLRNINKRPIFCNWNWKFWCILYNYWQKVINIFSALMVRLLKVLFWEATRGYLKVLAFF